MCYLFQYNNSIQWSHDMTLESNRPLMTISGIQIVFTRNYLICGGTCSISCLGLNLAIAIVLLVDYRTGNFFEVCSCFRSNCIQHYISH